MKHNMARNSEFPDRAAHVLKQFFSGPDAYDNAMQSVMCVLAENPDLSMAQLFGQVAFLRGKGKSHCSGAIEGEMKDS